MSAQVALGHPSAGCPVLGEVGDQAPILRLGGKITTLGGGRSGIPSPLAFWPVNQLRKVSAISTSDPFCHGGPVEENPAWC